MREAPIISKASIKGHPIHPALIHFPVAALVGLIASDLAYVFSADPFWARASFWLATVGVVGGVVSGTAGLVDIVFVGRIRRLVTAWSHAILAVMLLSVASLNWLLRFTTTGGEAIMPWGLYLSLLSGLLITAAALLGGQLVYEYAIGVDIEEATGRDVKP